MSHSPPGTSPRPTLEIFHTPSFPPGPDCVLRKGVAPVANARSHLVGTFRPKSPFSSPIPPGRSIIPSHAAYSRAGSPGVLSSFESLAHRRQPQSCFDTVQKFREPTAVLWTPRTYARAQVDWPPGGACLVVYCQAL